MRICLYLEHGQDSSWSSGIRQAYENHLRALRTAGVEVTSDPSDSFDVLHLETIGPASFYLAEKYNGQRPVVIHGHTTEEDFANSFLMSDVVAPYLGRLLTRYYNKANLVITPTAYTEGVLRRHEVTAPIAVVSNGVDVARFSSLARARSLGRGRHRLKGTVAFSVGMVLLRKGVDVFCDVARRLPDITFVWFGRIHKAVKPETLRVVEEAPPNVVFPGYVEDIAEAHAAGDIFFFPSLVENEGIAVLEAAAAGRPLVLRHAECFTGRFVHGGNCLLGRDAGELASAVSLLATDADLRERLGLAAREFAASHSLERVGVRLRRIYEKLV